MALWLYPLIRALSRLMQRLTVGCDSQSRCDSWLFDGHEQGPYGPGVANVSAA
jgi:hypothetical protein